MSATQSAPGRFEKDVLTMTQDVIPVTIRPLKKNELAQAHETFRLAFGTFIGLPDPLAFGGDTDFIRPRWQRAPENSFAAELTKPDGARALAGTNFVTRWGNFGFFGPLTVSPEFWDHGVGTKLVRAAIDRFDEWQLDYRGLFTFSNSPKHLELYRKFGFWPRFILAIMELPLDLNNPADTPFHGSWTTLDRLEEAERATVLAAAREFTGNMLPGLDLTSDMQGILQAKLGHSVFLWDGRELTGMAVTHLGPGSEAGSDTMYVRFAATRPGQEADFQRLLQACSAVARANGASKLVAGVSLECERTYVHMRQAGARIAFQGITMHSHNHPTYLHKDAFVLGDWR
jgi:GNAT superfamily N-acetyltransferase